MGQTLKNLSRKTLKSKPIFSNRFVVEVCEKMHVHYRNLRLVLSLDDWIKFAQGMKDSLDRWNKRGNPEPDARKHIELCRKQVAVQDSNDDIVINLNNNLYNHNKGIFSEGADFTEDEYIHLKIRDIRIELSLDEFKELSDGIKEASEKLENRDISSVLQKT